MTRVVKEIESLRGEVEDLRRRVLDLRQRLDRADQRNDELRAFVARLVRQEED